MTHFLLQFVGYLATGLVAGTIAGLFGIGGGIVIVPALLFAFHLDGINPVISMQLAVGTSLSTIIFTNLFAAWNHQRRGAIHWEMVRRYTPWVLLGAWLGTKLATIVDGETLRTLFGLFEISLGIRMLRTPPDNATLLTKEPTANPFVAMGIGTLSTLFGVGGGTMLVPALTLLSGLTIYQAIGSASAIGAMLAMAGTTGMIHAGWGNNALPPGTLGFVVPLAALGVIIGTLTTVPVGVRLAHKTESNLLRRGFGVLLLLVGIKFLWR
ncbi:MAG: sulfite exporter TauE/SafE family protein [Magnetococcales bacterium]|nr:sulfite exporter TauE/SafE family protein [Magnetococcales bacterium]